MVGEKTQWKREEAWTAGREPCRQSGTPTKDVAEEALVSNIGVFGVKELETPSSQTLMLLPALPSLLAVWFFLCFQPW